MIADMATKFPNQADSIRSWMPEYRTALERAEGDRLAEAYRVCMVAWKAGWAPRPADIASHLPGRNEFRSNSSDVIQQMTQFNREREQRVEAANVWWRDRNYESGLFWEYSHRCKHGLPSEKDHANFETLKRAQPPTPVPGFGNAVKPNFVPMPRSKPEVQAQLDALG